MAKIVQNEIEYSNMDIYSDSSYETTVNSIITTVNNNKIIKMGKICIFFFSFNTTNQLNAATWTNICKVPKECLPKYYIIADCMCYDGTVGEGSCQIQLEASGESAGNININPGKAHNNSTTKLIRGQLVWVTN